MYVRGSLQYGLRFIQYFVQYQYATAKLSLCELERWRMHVQPGVVFWSRVRVACGPEVRLSFMFPSFFLAVLNAHECIR
jgi:hypothetical protein